MKIDKFEDLDFKPKDSLEQVCIKVKDKLDLSLEDMLNAISKNIKEKADTLVYQFYTIAPYGKYEELMMDREEMLDFITTECSKPENWRLKSIQLTDTVSNLIQFTFRCLAIDEGEACTAIVFVDFYGKIKHTFAQGEDI